MNEHNDTRTIREVIEQMLAGVAFAAIVAYVAAGTLAMCLPGAGVA